MNYALVTVINLVIEFFSLMILVEVIGSWLLVMRLNLPAFVYDLLRVVQSITSIILNPLRRVIPSIGGLDLTPIIALFALDFLRRIVVSALLR
jgi:YggT family protein